LPAASKKKKRKGKESPSDDAILRFLGDHLASDFPNPERRGCPSNSLLDHHAAGNRKSDAKIVRHLLRCSPCFIYYTQKVRELSKRLVSRPAKSLHRAARAS
jgi:hypothetical protein